MRSLPRTNLLLVVFLAACSGVGTGTSGNANGESTGPTTARRHLLERVGDTGVIQLYADGFDDLSLRDKILCYHLANAAIAGRDIFIDQKFRYNLAIRGLLEELYLHRSKMPKKTADEIERYTKLFWLNNGIHDHLSTKKRLLQLSLDEFKGAVRIVRQAGEKPGSPHNVSELFSILSDPHSFESCTNKSPANGADPIESSCNNLYYGVSTGDIGAIKERFPLNSRLARKGGVLVEQVYRAGDPNRVAPIPPGLYANQLRNVIHHLELAAAIAPDKTNIVLEHLIEYYKTGDPQDWRKHNIAWVQDTDNVVDQINGFVEVYLDARGMKGAWEAVVSFVKASKAKAIKQLADEAQWFEDRMPWDPKYKKKNVKGIDAKVITVVMETGDSGPVTPIGINLPNEADIRKDHGSKSVNLGNVVEGYNFARSGGSSGEIAWSEEEAERAKQHAEAMSDVHTNLHEVIGHASGQIMAHIKNPAQILGTYYSTLEEGRADLVGLYWILDPKLREMGMVPNEDAALAKYESYARNALVQLRRVPPGGQIEEDHMRNRQMIVHWLIANSDAVKVEKRDGKTYYRVTSAKAFREGCGKLLAEVMRIKAEGDFKAGKFLVKTYGTKVDPTLHKEVRDRLERFNLVSSYGFVQPRLTAVRDANDEITDVKISYPMSLEDQMLRWSGRRK